MENDRALKKLVRNAFPVHNPGDYVFVSLTAPAPKKLKELAVVTLREKRGITFIIRKEIADKYQLRYDFVASWITLKISSSSPVIGLTAAFSKSLADSGVSCNVFGGYHYDHIFVFKEDTQLALEVLSSIGEDYFH